MSEDERGEAVSAAEADFPKTVFIAGIIWIVLGSSMLLISVLMAAAAGRVGMPGFWGLVFGIASVYVGAQSVRGTARGTLGNGVGSVIFALFATSLAVRVILRVLAAPGAEEAPSLIVGMLVGGATTVAAVGFFAAGVLALLDRQNYRTWRRAQKSSTASNKA